MIVQNVCWVRRQWLEKYGIFLHIWIHLYIFILISTELMIDTAPRFERTLQNCVFIFDGFSQQNQHLLTECNRKWSLSGDRNDLLNDWGKKNIWTFRPHSTGLNSFVSNTCFKITIHSNEKLVRIGAQEQTQYDDIKTESNLFFFKKTYLSVFCISKQ